MVNISEYLNIIQTAVYGKDMRAALHDAIKAVNEDPSSYIRDLTYSEYESLTTTEKLNGTTYYCTDTKQIFRYGIDYSGNSDNTQIGSSSGSPVLFSAANSPIKTFDVNLRPYQHNDWDKPWQGGTDRNKFQITAVTSVVNGITFTVTSDGRVILNGTSTAVTRFKLGTFSRTGTFIMNGCPTNRNGSYLIWYQESDLIHYNTDTGEGALVGNDSGEEHDIAIHVPYGKTYDNLIFLPMVRTSGTETATWRPYENICPLSKRSTVHVNLHGANLFNREGVTRKDNFIIEESGYVASSMTEREVPSSDCGYITGIKVQPTTVYTISGPISNDDTLISIYEFDRTGTYVLITKVNQEDLPFTFTTRYWTQSIGFSYKMDVFNPNRVQVNTGLEAIAYEPYNNKVDVTFNLGASTWGGTWHGIGGVMVERWVEIPAYAGEVLSGEWMSDRDEYSPDRIPTIGAQVVYLASGATSQFSTNSVRFNTILGYNTLWVDYNDILYVEFINRSWEDVVRIDEITQEEYDLINEADQYDGTIRFITDKGYIYLNGIIYGAGGGGIQHSSTAMSFNRLIPSDILEIANSINVTERSVM